MITGSAYAKSMGGSTIFLDEGEQLSVRDMLKGIAVSSGNDAAVAMGEHIAGSADNFVAMMNNRAKELGMNDTNFVNCNGLDAEGHYSSAYDIALMSRELMKHEDIFEFTSIWMDSLRNGDFTLSNTNKLIRFYDGATGLKTGSTDKAKFCISATAKRGNMHLIAVIMAAPSSKERSADASKLLNYGFAGYGVLSCAEKGEVCDSIYIPKSGKDKVDIVCGEGAGYLYEKAMAPQLDRTITLRDDISAPLSEGECVGNMQIKNGDEVIADIPLITAENIPKRGLGGTFFWLMGMWARV
jgi:D-alanyl-D-alanine carboxypeptidase (penicillin-binding protein 5/6)